MCDRIVFVQLESRVIALEEAVVAEHKVVARFTVRPMHLIHCQDPQVPLILVLPRATEQENGKKDSSDGSLRFAPGENCRFSEKDPYQYVILLRIS